MKTLPETILEVTRKAPPVDIDRVREAESQLRKKLPDDFVEFVTQISDGCYFKQMVMCPVDPGYGDEFSDVTGIYGIGPTLDDMGLVEANDSHDVANSIIFARSDIGDNFLFVYDENGSSTIKIHDHESDPDDPEFWDVCDSFGDFLTLLELDTE
ncbi:MAG: SMI1/KNR4 family protein [Armatimonadetes bacterium]|nr:SMI1/KNR4 family protein [Armatimonadota bacterium]